MPPSVVSELVRVEDVFSAIGDASRVPSRNRRLLVYLHVPFCNSKCLFCDWVVHQTTRDPGSGRERGSAISTSTQSVVRSAFIDGYMYYHSEFDDVGHLSLASLQHHGDNMLEIVRSLGDADLTQSSAGDERFFDLLGRWVIHYPVSWALPLAIVLALPIAVGAVLAVRFKKLTISGVVAGLAIAVLAPVVAAAAGWAAWAALRVSTNAHRLPQGHAYDDCLALLAILAW